MLLPILAEILQNVYLKQNEVPLFYLIKNDNCKYKEKHFRQVPAGHWCWLAERSNVSLSWTHIIPNLKFCLDNSGYTKTPNAFNCTLHRNSSKLIPPSPALPPLLSNLHSLKAKLWAWKYSPPSPEGNTHWACCFYISWKTHIPQLFSNAL